MHSPIAWPRAAIISLACCLFGLPAASQDWSDCASELDALRRRAADASSAAEEAEDKKRRAETARQELQQCLQFPQVYDFMRDSCNSKRLELQSALDDYKRQLRELEDGLNDVDSKVRGSASACSMELSRVVGPAPTIPAGVLPGNKDACALYLRYKGRLPATASLLQTCSKQIGDSQCRLCLGQ